jgi:hypothetical protein
MDIDDILEAAHRYDFINGKDLQSQRACFAARSKD